MPVINAKVYVPDGDHCNSCSHKDGPLMDSFCHIFVERLNMMEIIGDPAKGQTRIMHHLKLAACRDLCAASIANEKNLLLTEEGVSNGNS